MLISYQVRFVHCVQGRFLLRSATSPQRPTTNQLVTEDSSKRLMPSSKHTHTLTNTLSQWRGNFLWAAGEARSNHCLSTGKLPELISAPICLSSLLRGEVGGHIPSSVSVDAHASLSSYLWPMWHHTAVKNFAWFSLSVIRMTRICLAQWPSPCALGLSVWLFTVSLHTTQGSQGGMRVETEESEQKEGG